MSAGGRTKHLARETAESSAGAGRILLELAISPLPESNHVIENGV